MIGSSLAAQSSSLKRSAVAARAMSAALRACTNGSRSERANAAVRTFARLLEPKFLAILPKQIVVFVRIPGCSSFAVLARCRKSSPLMTRSDNFGTIVRIDLTVCSRTTGARSVKPVTYVGVSSSLKCELT
jgi:hypothetical protein